MKLKSVVGKVADSVADTEGELLGACICGENSIHTYKHTYPKCIHSHITHTHTISKYTLNMRSLGGTYIRTFSN